ncbi:MAG: hypothetical protein Q9186_004318 [Xanthomendoza sp. 1 TL-2023]
MGENFTSIVEELLDTNLLIHKLLHTVQQERSDAVDDESPPVTSETLTAAPSSSVIPPVAIEEAPTTEFIETSDFVDIEAISDIPDIEIPPPLRRQSAPDVEDKSEEVPLKYLNFDIDTFQMALGLWCQDTAITRQQYSGLLVVLALLNDQVEIQVQALPKSIETLHRKTQSHLPLIKMRKQQIPLVAAKLPTAGKAFSSTPMDWLF